MARDTKTRTTTPAAAPSEGAAEHPVAAAAGAGTPAVSSSDAEVAAFVARARAMQPAPGARGRLIFAMDATMSRQPTWDMALHLQAEMFEAVRRVGGLDVQLIYFRGTDECRASRWVTEPAALARLMTQVTCAGGHTQIRKVLSHARREAEARRVNALVHVGDAMEESVDDLCHRAGELAVLGIPVFLFQEGRDPNAEQTFREIARITNGAWCRFDPGSARQLRELLSAVAVYAAGGSAALRQLASEGAAGATALIGQMR
jgi:hypothetical protein